MACGSNVFYASTPGIEQHAFLRAFFFSVETLSTIGYRKIVLRPAFLPIWWSPLKPWPGSAGLLWLPACCSRCLPPNCQGAVQQSRVIAPYQDSTALEFRVADARSNELIEVSAKVIVSRFEEVDGVRTRRLSAGAGAGWRCVSALDLDRRASH